MRIVQIIDSLETGGAERMALNYANELSNLIEFSGLVVTRNEGMLTENVNKNVDYFFLDKKSTFDIKALFKLRNYISKNKINFIHAHSTSFFFAFLLKLTLPKIKLIWHDHYGDSEFLSNRPTLLFKIVIPFFDGVIVVNQKLKLWNQNILRFKNTICLPNFVIFENNEIKSTFLAGKNNKRIICLANLRPQKDHFMLLGIAKQLMNTNPDWTFHLVGKDFKDEYSDKLKNAIYDFKLNENVFVYDSKKDIQNILNQSAIAILTSKSEGLPVAILEYGLNSKAVISTNVGDISTILINNFNGYLVESGNVENFYNALSGLIENTELITTFGKNLNETVNKKFNIKIVVQEYLEWLKKN